jgi:hypothetical protein
MLDVPRSSVSRTRAATLRAVACALPLLALLLLAPCAFAASAPEVTKQPASQEVLEGEGASFEATASGEPAPTVQWEVSTNNGVTWEAVAGATSDTLTIASTKVSESSDEFHAVFSNGVSPNATTTPATLTVDQVPVTDTPGGSGGGSSTGSSTSPPTPSPVARIARYLALSMATAPVVTKGAVTFHFKYTPGRFRATHCAARASGRYRCKVSWRHGNYAFAGTVEVGNLNVYTGDYTYGLRVVRTNVRTRRHTTLTVPY